MKAKGVPCCNRFPSRASSANYQSYSWFGKKQKNGQGSSSHTSMRTCTWSPATERTHVNPRAKEADTGGSLGTVGSLFSQTSKLQIRQETLPQKGREVMQEDTQLQPLCPPPHGVKTDIINVKLNIYDSKQLILHMTNKFPKLKLLSLPR